MNTLHAFQLPTQCVTSIVAFNFISLSIAWNMFSPLYVLCLFSVQSSLHYLPHTYIAGGCSSAVVGAAVGSFIGGVLLTAAIAGVIAVVVLNRFKRELSARTG